MSGTSECFFFLGTWSHVLARMQPQFPPTARLLIREAAGSSRLTERQRARTEWSRLSLSYAGERSTLPPLGSQQALLRGHVIQTLVWMGLVMASVAQCFKPDFTPRQAV